jgi:hypothetical protein
MNATQKQTGRNNKNHSQKLINIYQGKSMPNIVYIET